MKSRPNPYVRRLKAPRISMTSTKQIEASALEVFRSYVAHRLPGCVVEDTRNKGASRLTAVGDVVLTLSDGRRVDIEIKSSQSAVLPTNLRFTHQTISSARGKDLVVALVWALASQHPKLAFFRLGDVQDELIVEPHFIVQTKQLAISNGAAPILTDDLAQVLEASPRPLDLSELLKTEVGQHVRQQRGA